MPIESPFPWMHNPLETIREENTAALHNLVRTFRTMETTAAVWHLRLLEERRAVFQHLWNHVELARRQRADRFTPLRQMVAQDMITEAEFVLLADTDDFDGQVPMALKPYAALYFEGPVNHATLSSDALYRTYCRVHGKIYRPPQLVH